MLYKNITNKSQYIVAASVKQLIPPGEVINLSLCDIRHAGSNIRNFESILKAQEMSDFLLDRSAHKKDEKFEVK